MYPDLMDLGLEDMRKRLSGAGLDDYDADMGTAAMAPALYREREKRLGGLANFAFTGQKPQEIDLSFGYDPKPAQAEAFENPVLKMWNAQAKPAATLLPFQAPEDEEEPYPQTPAADEGQDFFAKQRAAMNADPRFSQPAYDALDATGRAAIDAQMPPGFQQHTAKTVDFSRGQPPAAVPGNADKAVAASVTGGPPAAAAQQRPNLAELIAASVRKAGYQPYAPGMSAEDDQALNGPPIMGREAKIPIVSSPGNLADAIAFSAWRAANPGGTAQEFYSRRGYDVDAGPAAASNVVRRAQFGDRNAINTLWEMVGRDRGAYARAVSGGALPFQIEDDVRNAAMQQARERHELGLEQGRHGMNLADRKLYQQGEQFDKTNARLIAAQEADTKHKARLAAIEEARVNGQISDAQAARGIQKANLDFDREKFQAGQATVADATAEAKKQGEIGQVLTLAQQFMAPGADGSPGMDAASAMQTARALVRAAADAWPGNAGNVAGGRETNNLIDAGFTVTDPEGHAVARFDEGPEGAPAGAAADPLAELKAIGDRQTKGKGGPKVREASMMAQQYAEGARGADGKRLPSLPIKEAVRRASLNTGVPEDEITVPQLSMSQAAVDASLQDLGYKDEKDAFKSAVDTVLRNLNDGSNEGFAGTKVTDSTYRPYFGTRYINNRDWKIANREKIYRAAVENGVPEAYAAKIVRKFVNDEGVHTTWWSLGN